MVSLIEGRAQRILKSSSPFILFTGENIFCKEKVLQRLKEKLGKNQNIWINLDPQETPLEEIISHITSLPLFSQTKFILIRRGNKLPNSFWKRLPGLKDRIHLSTKIIIWLEKIPTEIKNLTDVVFIDFPKWKKGSVELWVKEKLEESGKIMEKEAWEVLWNKNENNLFALENELEKLINFTGKRPNITLKDVEEVSCEGKEITIFNVVDLLIEGKKGDALKEWEKLRQAGISVQLLIGVLNWEVKRLLFLKDELEKKWQPELFQKMKIWGKEKQISYWKAIKNKTWDEWIKIYRELLRTDLKLKSGYPVSPTVEILLYRIAGKGR
ncbi:MAG TPA: DNA polymerase III subunit delta [bacterium]|nr:DNA polymerase III subunit delta [bacterium]HEX67531.1 DNA polymerase III subunit delta [bacterium]